MLGGYARVSALLVGLAITADAAVISFATDPFAGSTALTTPGRQIVGGEPSITFNSATDTFAFDLAVFGVSRLQFFNGTIGSLPSSGVNVVVLRTFGNDADPSTPFGAGNAADLIAGQITAPGPGFFIYFNSGLNLPRLVYSTDLNDNTADLKILARMTNLTGNTGALEDFRAANFAAVPEPSSLMLITCAAAACAFRLRRRNRG